MNRLNAATRVVKLVVPGLLVLALVLGVFLPGSLLAAPDGKQGKPTVEQLQNRSGYRGNPWAVARPSCSSNRYYAQYPQQRYQPRPQVNWQPRYENNHYDRCKAVVYQVHRGDTLSGIARRYGVSAQALAHANGLRNPHRIYAGQRLHIPSSGYCR